VLPEERDTYEQAKYDMYSAAGDAICEVTSPRTTSGTEIRNLLRANQHDALLDKLPKTVLEELNKE